MGMHRIIALEIPRQQADSLGAFLSIWLKLGSTLYTDVVVQDGLFGWEVLLMDWKK